MTSSVNSSFQCEAAGSSRAGTALLLVWACLLSVAAPARAQSPRPPNIVLVLIDDLGWRDLGVTGSTFYETPHIDRLAVEGARFSRFYAASPVCSPTRASVQTGRNPARLRITNWIGGADAGRRLREPAYAAALPLEEVTLAEALAPAGYVSGYIGKWHLGAPPAMPRDQGYAVSRTVNHAGQPGAYFPPYGTRGQPNFVPDLEGDPAGTYLTDRLTDEAVAFIEAHRKGPFLLVLGHYAVHTPLQAQPDLTAKYETKAARLPPVSGPALLPEGPGAQTRQRQDHGVYAAMVESVDRSVGRLLDTLGTLGLERDTVVVFLSDNGGLSTLAGNAGGPTSNLPLRAGKGWLYEGGIRVPLIVRWPGRIPAGSIVDTPAITDDLLPTLVEFAGLRPAAAQELDGVSLAPLFRGQAIPARPLFWHFPHYHGSGHTPAGAVRSGQYKLVEWLEDGRLELYDLQADEAESRDLAGTLPAKARELRSLLQSWRARVGAALPQKR
jgi:arylsulfatase A-like enzyme